MGACCTQTLAHWCVCLPVLPHLRSAANLGTFSFCDEEAAVRKYSHLSESTKPGSGRART